MKYKILVIVFAVISYFIGNINWSIIISKSKNKDIRKLGSGNPGTLNMSRNFGLKLGLLTLLLDLLKGAVPTLVSFFVFKDVIVSASNFNLSDLAIYVSGFFAVLGHIYPIIYGFKGGKGIATSIGVLLVCTSVHGLSWAMIAVMAMIAAILFIYFTEFGAMGSFIAISIPAIAESVRLFLYYSFSNQNVKTVVLSIISNALILSICFFTWFAHRKNIERMLLGDEHPTSIKSMIVSAKAKKIENKQSPKEK